MEQTMGGPAVIDKAVEPSRAGISGAGRTSGRRGFLCADIGVVVAGHRARIVHRISLGKFRRLRHNFEFGTGLYFIVMAMISSAMGGYLAGRLRNRWIGVQV